MINSSVKPLFGKSWKLTRKFKLPEKKLDALSNKQRQTDLGMLEVPFHHTTVTFMGGWRKEEANLRIAFNNEKFKFAYLHDSEAKLYLKKTKVVFHQVGSIKRLQ